MPSVTPCFVAAALLYMRTQFEMTTLDNYAVQFELVEQPRPQVHSFLVCPVPRARTTLAS